MKKLVLIAIAVLSFTASQAQFDFKPGVKAGVNIARFTDTNDGDKALIGYHIEATFGLKLASFYTLQPELSYTKQGNRYLQAFQVSNDQDFSNDESFFNYEVDYLSLSLVNKFYVFRGLNIQVAPFFDILLSDSINANNDFTEPIDIGITGGMGYDFPIGLVVDARFKQGFVPVTDSNSNGNNTFDNYQANQVIQLSVGYQF